MVGFDNLAIGMYSFACLYLVWFSFFVWVGVGERLEVGMLYILGV